MKDELELDRLLARGGLGGPSYDAIFERVLSGKQAPRLTRSRRALRVLGVPLAAAAAFALWFALAPRDRFTARGSASIDSGLELGCGSAGRACQVGDTLIFSVNAAVTSGYLGAYAVRSDDPRQERIWYFPSLGAVAPRVTPGAGTVTLPDGIRVGREHAPGHYRVELWLSAQPFQRADAKQALASATSSKQLELEILP